MIEEILEKGHKIVMGSAQKLVDSWNWVTGSDKYTLANAFIGLSTIPLFLTISQENHEMRNELTRNLGNVSIFMYGCTLSKAMRYKNKLKGLEDCQEEVRHIEAEQIKESSVRMGYFSETMGLMSSVPLQYLATTCINVNGATCFILASNNPKKRKNCIRRGFDKLNQIIDSYHPIPTTPLISTKS